MEQKNISFDKGISRLPFPAAEGEMSECVNLVPSKGGLINIRPPKDMGITFVNGDILVHVHATNTYTHYIAYSKERKNLTWYDKESQRTVISSSLGSWTDIGSLGNTLIVLTKEKRIFYIFNDGEYEELGETPELPEMEFSMTASRLEINPKQDKLGSGKWVYTAELHKDAFSVTSQSDNYQETLASTKTAFYAGVNFMRENAYNEGLFIYPFKICYVLTFYDGSTARISAPILLAPSCYHAFNNFCYKAEGPKMRLTTVACKLMYKIILPENISRWQDIVRSIDFYITKPLQTISENTTNGDFELIKTQLPGIMLNMPRSGIYSTDTPKMDYYQDIPAYDSNFITFWFVRSDNYNLSEEDINRRLMEDGTFYFLASVDISDLKNNEWEAVLGVENTLPIIENQKTLDWEAGSNNEIIPGKLFVYNGRVNYYNIYRIPFKGYDYFSSWYVTDDNRTYFYKIYVYLKTETNEKTVVLRTFMTNAQIGWYFFYPDSGAYKAVIEKYIPETSQKTGHLILTLKRLPLMNAAYYFSNFPGGDIKIRFTESNTPLNIEVTEGKTFYSGNKIYTSEVDNPFSVKTTNINTAGTGEILAISTATKALSEGQFGQYPLYVFCTDGINAMQVSDSGTFSSIHPVSRDVCNNPDAVTQTDSTIVFTTAKGLMFLQGSVVSLLSAKMDGENPDETPYAVMDGFSDLFVKDTDSFVHMLETCMISYDYSHSLLHIYPSGDTAKHYVYSLEAGEFSSCVGSRIITAVPAYPAHIIQIGNRLYTHYSLDEPDILRQGMFITNPIPFGNPLAVKVLADLRMLYSRTSAQAVCRIAVWVSNNLNRWHRLKSLRAGAFKWYRFAVFTKLTDNDVLAGMTCMTEERRTNKIR